MICDFWPAVWNGNFYALPTLVLVTAIVYFGVGANLVFSTWNWNGISPNPELVGFDNYVKMFGDPVFWQAIRNTLIFSIFQARVDPARTLRVE